MRQGILSSRILFSEYFSGIFSVTRNTLSRISFAEYFSVFSWNILCDKEYFPLQNIISWVFLWSILCDKEYFPPEYDWLKSLEQLSKNPPLGPAIQIMMVVSVGAWQDVTNVTNQGNTVRSPDSMWQMWQMQSRPGEPRVLWWATWTLDVGLWWAAWWWRHATLALWQKISTPHAPTRSLFSDFYSPFRWIPNCNSLYSFEDLRIVGLKQWCWLSSETSWLAECGRSAINFHSTLALPCSIFLYFALSCFAIHC